MALMWSGKKIELFQSLDANSDGTCGGTQPHADRPLYGGDIHGDPAELWNYMVTPILNMPIQGVIWHHGESEAGSDTSESYACRLPALIADWRIKFDKPDMTFLIVQLTASRYTDFSAIRDAQMSAMLLPHTSYAVTIDIGESNWEDVEH